MYFTKHCQTKSFCLGKPLIEKKLPGYDARVTSIGGAATFGGNMRREREARQLTLEEVGRRLGLKRPAPLSTLERSNHIPKAETIKEYAAAIGCTPADLLAGVVTEYDVLRGSAAPTSQPAPSVEKLTRTEKRALVLLRATSDARQPAAVRSLALHAHAYPRGATRAPNLRTGQRSLGPSRKGRGTR